MMHHVRLSAHTKRAVGMEHDEALAAARDARHAGEHPPPAAVLHQRGIDERLVANSLRQRTIASAEVHKPRQMEAIRALSLAQVAWYYYERTRVRPYLRWLPVEWEVLSTIHLELALRASSWCCQPGRTFKTNALRLAHRPVQICSRVPAKRDLASGLHGTGQILALCLR